MANIINEIKNILYLKTINHKIFLKFKSVIFCYYCKNNLKV